MWGIRRILLAFLSSLLKRRLTLLVLLFRDFLLATLIHETALHVKNRPFATQLKYRHSILIENLGETLEAVLTPVIQRAVIYRGRKMYIKLGDSEVEFHPDFRSEVFAEPATFVSIARISQHLYRPLCSHKDIHA